MTRDASVFYTEQYADLCHHPIMRRSTQSERAGAATHAGTGTGTDHFRARCVPCRLLPAPSSLSISLTGGRPPRLDDWSG